MDILSSFAEEKEIIEKIVAPKFLEKGYVIIPKKEFDSLSRGSKKAVVVTAKAKPKKAKAKKKVKTSTKRGHKTPLEVWGVSYESVADCARKTGIDKHRINYAVKKNQLEKIIPKP